MKKIIFGFITAIAIPTFLTGCANSRAYHTEAPKAVPEEKIHNGALLQLEYNLHPNMRKRVINAENYQVSGALLKRCTPVKILYVSSTWGKIVFSLDDGTTLYWLKGKHILAPFTKHAENFFVSQCTNPNLDGFSEIDKRGIERGEAIVGMSKRGVLYAIGLPPDHETLSLDQNIWTYWSNRFARIKIRFEDDLVISIEK